MVFIRRKLFLSSTILLRSFPSLQPPPTLLRSFPSLQPPPTTTPFSPSSCSSNGVDKDSYHAAAAYCKKLHPLPTSTILLLYYLISPLPPLSTTTKSSSNYPPPTRLCRLLLAPCDLNQKKFSTACFPQSMLSAIPSSSAFPKSKIPPSNGLPPLHSPASRLLQIRWRRPGHLKNFGIRNMPPVYKCLEPECRRGFKSRQELVAHYIAEHKDVLESLEHECDKCGGRTRYKEELLEHKRKDCPLKEENTSRRKLREFYKKNRQEIEGEKKGEAEGKED